MNASDEVMIEFSKQLHSEIAKYYVPSELGHPTSTSSRFTLASKRGNLATIYIEWPGCSDDDTTTGYEISYPMISLYYNSVTVRIRVSDPDCIKTVIALLDVSPDLIAAMVIKHNSK